MPRKTYCLEVSGDFACFTRPEMKVERVSYDVITPSAARAVFEAILWKPALRWVPVKIEVMRPIRWISVRRNEVGSKIAVSNVKSAMNKAGGSPGLYIEDDRQQRAGLFLRDVRYRLHAYFEMTGHAHRFHHPHLAQYAEDGEESGPRDAANTVEKFHAMFERRAAKGQCINQPYLGCREFACDVRLVAQPAAEPSTPIDETRDLGWMLYDMDYRDPADPMPRFFNARMQGGVVEIPEPASDEVRG
ncbi:MAG: type I-C CRISPR-associated protein Cas5c [Burkholderiaceae bacterium]